MADKKVEVGQIWRRKNNVVKVMKVNKATVNVRDRADGKTSNVKPSTMLEYVKG